MNFFISYSAFRLNLLQSHGRTRPQTFRQIPKETNDQLGRKPGLLKYIAIFLCISTSRACTHQRHLKIPRRYTDISVTNAQHVDLRVFSDVSSRVIALLAYLNVINSDISWPTEFVLRNAKLASVSPYMISCLKIIASVSAIRVIDTLSEELDLESDNLFNTDCKVVLEYIKTLLVDLKFTFVIEWLVSETYLL